MTRKKKRSYVTRPTPPPPDHSRSITFEYAKTHDCPIFESWDDFARYFFDADCERGLWVYPVDPVYQSLAVPAPEKFYDIKDHMRIVIGGSLPRFEDIYLCPLSLLGYRFWAGYGSETSLLAVRGVLSEEWKKVEAYNEIARKANELRRLRVERGSKLGGI
jgi:hypothetical protein